jgi:prepilin-type N-terminal cleavage/methylation domain-containing protein
MKSPTCKGSEGFTLLELMVVISIIGTLTSIALPNYLRYRSDARRAACQANRRNIETAESTYFADHDMPNLSIGSIYSCPSGGVYVWLVSDPEDPGYPTVACSVHYAGSLETPDRAIDNPPATPGEAMEQLIDVVKGLDLPDNVENVLLKRLEKAKLRYEKDRIEKSDKTLDWFKNQIKKNRKEIDDEDEALLNSKADEIQEMLRQMP